MPNNDQGDWVDIPQWASVAKPGPYNTQLSQSDEANFQQWIKQNKIPWQDSPTSDYDMRGFWKAQQSGDPQARRNSSNLHFPDTWKTPYHQTFSNESEYALPSAGHWDGNRFVPPTPDLKQKAQQASEGDWEDVPQQQAQPQDQGKLIAGKPSLLQRIKGWWNNAPAYQGTLDEPGRSPSQFATEGAEGAAYGASGAAMVADPMLAVRGAVGTSLGSKAGGYIGGEFGPTGRAAGKVIGGAVGGFAGLRRLPPGSLPGELGALRPLLERAAQKAGPGIVEGTIPQQIEEQIAAAQEEQTQQQALRDRSAAEQEAGKLVRTPEELRAGQQASRAYQSLNDLNIGKASAEGMIRAGRGTSPQLTNEEVSLLRRAREAAGQ